MATERLKTCKHCKKDLTNDEINVLGPNAWKCGFCGKSTTDKGHKLVGRGPWCPKCLFEFNDGKPTNESWVQACAAISGEFQLECPGCHTNVLPVWKASEKKAETTPAPAAETAPGPKPEVALARVPDPGTSPDPSAEMPQSKLKKGTIRVWSTLHKLDPEVELKEIDVEVFLTDTCTVSYTMEAAIRDEKGYQIGKGGVFVSWPCYVEEFKEAKVIVKKIVRAALADLMKGKKSDSQQPL